MLPKLSVVVPTRGRAHLLPALVDAVLNQVGVPHVELILVDDASRDDTWQVLRNLARSRAAVKVRRLDKHRGAAAARNVGWRAAAGEVIAFTDDDCMPSSTWLVGLVTCHEHGADVVQGRTEADVAAYAERGTFSHSVEIPEATYRFETCNVSYRRALLETLGGFNEEFGKSLGGAPFGEDADLGWRAMEAGASVAFAPEAVVVHPLTPSSYRRHLASRLRRYRMVYFIRLHGGYRVHMPKPWLFNGSHPYALAPLVGLAPILIGRRAVALVASATGAAVYVHFRLNMQRLPGRRQNWPFVVAGAWLADVVEVGVLAAGSIRWRRLLI